MKRSKLPPEQKEIAVRLREQRTADRFSQAELGRESDLGRAALSNYEYGLAALPFGAGIKLCRRLDLNQAWLATGRGPIRPYVPLSDLGVDAAAEESFRGSFLEGCQELLAGPMREWVRQHPPEALVGARLAVGTAGALARMSKLGLERFIREWSARLREQEHPRMKLAVLGNIQAAAKELERRLEASAARGK